MQPTQVEILCRKRLLSKIAALKNEDEGMRKDEKRSETGERTIGFISRELDKKETFCLSSSSPLFHLSYSNISPKYR